MAERNSLNFIWKGWPAGIKDRGLGHGIEFWDVTRDSKYGKKVVAFVDGFEWLHGYSDDVIIYCDEPDEVFPASEIEAMKQEVEEVLSKRVIKTQTWMVTTRIRAHING